MSSVISYIGTSSSSPFWIITPSEYKPWSHNNYSLFLISMSNHCSGLIDSPTEMPPMFIALSALLTILIHLGVHCFLIKSFFKNPFLLYIFHFQAFYFFCYLFNHSQNPIISFSSSEISMSSLTHFPNWIKFKLSNPGIYDSPKSGWSLPF